METTTTEHPVTTPAPVAKKVRIQRNKTASTHTVPATPAAPAATETTVASGTTHTHTHTASSDSKNGTKSVARKIDSILSDVITRFNISSEDLKDCLKNNPHMPQNSSYRKKQKKERDVDAPKKPSSPYIKFTIAHRPVLKAQEPTLNGKFVTIKMGAIWRTLTEEQKLPYIKQVEEEKVKYQQDVEAYKERKRASVSASA